MDIETLAYKMRERALAIQSNEDKEVETQRKLHALKLERFKKLYFNAGRYAGGARDKLAKEAFERVRLHG